MNKTETTYDLIIWDVFNSTSSVPFELTTQEAIQLVYSRLQPDGLVLVNMISSFEGKGNLFFKSMHKTYSSVFNTVVVYGVDSPTEEQLQQNIILVASKEQEPSLHVENKIIKKKQYQKTVMGGVLFTDNYAPANYLLTN